jgi:hypothetical protein
VITVNDYTYNHDFSGATLVLSDLGEPNVPCQVIQGDLNGNNFLNLSAFLNL